MRRLLLSGLMVLAFSVTAFAGVDVSKLQLPGDITQAQADTVIKGALAKAKEQGVLFCAVLLPQQGHQKSQGHKQEKVQQILHGTREDINEQFKIEIRRKYRFHKQQLEHASHCHKPCHIKGKEP